jgi:acetoin utilization protein AcuC
MSATRVSFCPPSRKAALIAADRQGLGAYGKNHPLAIPRVSLAVALIRAYGALAEEELLAPRKAADYELTKFHTPDYVLALKRSEALGRVSSAHRARHRLGTLENPYFERFFSIAAVAAGGSLQAAEAVLAGRVAFNPAGGMHHARPDHARGFCYVNDPVLAILRLKGEGWRVLYLDLDAHHGDGVEEAFADEPDVLTLSLHMDTAYAYPHRGGRLEDAGTAPGRHTTINVPLPPRTHDGEYRLLFDVVWGPALERFAPDVIVLQAGTDVLAADPLGKLAVSTQCFLDICGEVLRTAPRHPDGTPRLLATGGGGYHPALLARAWAGLWGLLSGRTLPDEIPLEAAERLRAAACNQDEDAPGDPRLYRSRLDEPTGGPIRPEVVELARRLAAHPFFRG